MNGKTGYGPYQAGVTDADAVVRPSVTKEGTLRCNLHKTWVWIPFDLAGMTGSYGCSKRTARAPNVYVNTLARSLGTRLRSAQVPHPLVTRLSAPLKCGHLHF